MRIDILTLFPQAFLGPFQQSILKRAQQRGLLTLIIHQIRDYALDRHQMTDDVPYGGGEGMVMRPDPIFLAVRSILGTTHTHETDTPVILLTPQGRQLTQGIITELAQYARLLFICGHYEGVDERVRQHLVTDEVSIGDYVLTGGELAAMVVVDAVARFIPGVLGASEGAYHDSYATGLLEGPHYTRPAVFEGWDVPDVLRSGDHARVARWKRDMALKRTLERRPELLAQMALTAEDRVFLDKVQGFSGEPDDA